MNYHNITFDDMLNGDGLRTVLWVAGCDHHCPECQNPITWDVNGGIPFDNDAFNELMDYLSRDHIAGVTFSGGDPLQPENRDTIFSLIKRIKPAYPNKSVWIYTGYLWEEIKDLPVIRFTDVLVDGHYMKELRNTALHWVGSSNQRIIDVQKTIESGNITLYEDSCSKLKSEVR